MSADLKAQADLIDAILSLDSYDHGYGSAINWTVDHGIEPTQIGNYTIVSQSDNRVSAANPTYAAGFYAIAYSNGSNTIISYRGTDKTGGSDVWHELS